MLTINTTKKDGGVDNSKLREEGKIPAVFYGPKEESTSVILDEVEFNNVFKEAGESTIVAVKAGDDTHDALIHDVQYNAVTGKVIHVDFYVVEKGKKISVSVPLEFVGESEAVKSLGGNLVKVMHELEIEVLPKDLPSLIEVSIESLVDFESQIHVKDVILPEGVEAKVDLEDVIALVQEAKEEEEEPEVEEVDLDSIEVEQKGKGEEEGEGGDEAAPAEESKE